jgi:hypothetical protein
MLQSALCECFKGCKLLWQYFVGIVRQQPCAVVQRSACGMQEQNLGFKSGQTQNLAAR